MTKSIRTGLFAIMLVVGLLAMASGGTIIFAQDQTVPTRTPTPGPTSPSQPSPTSDSGGGDNPAPNPTQTSESPGDSTATATTVSSGGGSVAPTTTATPLASGSQIDPVTGAAVPGLGLPGLCDVPTITVSDLILVHAGPGSDFPVVGSLPAQETRLIVGRAEFAPWWQILLIATEPQLLAWVADGDHTFAGDMNSVEIVEAPLLNGIAPTPGVLWQPTPLPFGCTPTATPTVTPSATPTATVIAGASGTSTDGAAAIVVESGSAAELDSQGSNVGKQQLEGDTAETMGAEDTTTETSDSTGVAPLLVPLLGAALIAGGAAIALLSRARPPAA